jgi:transposase
MSRTSPYTIRLTTGEAAELQRRAAKYTLPYFQVQRAKIVLLAAEGLTNEEIATRLDTRREVVWLWRKRFFSERLAGLDERPRPGRPGLFPPDLVVQIKAWACELPANHGLPLSRWSTSDLVREACQSGLVASISGSTLWRWLHEDAIRPWYHRSWIFPRDPDFAEKAGRLLDLYGGGWCGKSLKDDEFVISADEKHPGSLPQTSHPALPTRHRDAGGA